ncbi:MAG: porin [Deltaproteobacteria bacterium]|nr:porin [Deltaproteobacteria bacterium]
MRLVKRLFELLIVLALASGPVLAADVNTLEKEIQNLKKENSDLKERVDAIEADDEELKHGIGSLSKLVEVSGYADAEFFLTGQEGENNKFRIRHLSLFFTKEIQTQWKLFTEIEFEGAPRIESNTATDTVKSSQGTIFVEQMYIEYHPAVSWDMRFGRFLTPAGIWSIYHYPPYVPTQSAPLIFKVIFPEVSDGVQLRNSFTLKDSALDTHLYLSNGSGNPGRLDRNENKGVGLRINSDLLAGFSTGASYFREQDNDGTWKNSYGVHLLYGYSAVKFQAEYELRHNSPEGEDSFNDLGGYLQLAYDIGKWTLAGRYDWYDSSSKISDNTQSRYTGAINYHFGHNVIGKFEVNRNKFDAQSIQDYNEAILGIIVAIGDL